MYVGKSMTQAGQLLHEIKMSSKVANIMKNRNVTMIINGKVHNEYVLPSMVYGSETWELKKAGFTLRAQIYAVYADHFAHLGRVFSATNADLRRSDRADAEYKHSYSTPFFSRGCWIVIG